MNSHIQYRNKNLKTLSRCLLFFVLFFVAFHVTVVVQNDRSVLLSLLPHTALAVDPLEYLGEKVGDGVSWAFSWLLVGTLQVWGFLIGVGEWVLNWALDADSVNAVLNSTAISEAWKVVRDFLNILFIIFLLFSAFATIFQVKKYHLKSVMLMVVIMALLVNFSYPIARFVIDTGNVPMYYMLQKAFASSGSAAAAEISNQSNVVCQLVPNYGDCKATASELVALGVAQLLAANIFTFMFAITLVIIAILFVIRLAVLGFLIVLSPAGFVLAAFPSMQQYADDWWKQLIKQTFFGPIMVFMIILSVKFMATLNAEALNAVHGGGTSTSTGFPQTIAKFAIPMVILWSGLIIAQKMGAAGADIVVGGGRKFMLGIGRFLTTRPAKALAGAVGHRIDRGLAKTPGLRYFSPTAVKTAWKRREELADRQAFGRASGKVQTGLNRAMHTLSTMNLLAYPWRTIRRTAGAEFSPAWIQRTLGRKTFHPAYDKTNYGFIAAQEDKNKYRKEIADVSVGSDYVIQQLKDAQREGNAAKAAAAVELLAKENNYNDWMPTLGKETNSKNVKDSLENLFKSVGMAEQDIAQQLNILSEVANQAGGLGFGGMSKYNGKKWVMADPKEQAGAVAGKISNLEPQAFARTAHPDIFVTEDADGNPTGINGEVGLAVLRSLQQPHVRQFKERARGDLVKKLGKLHSQYRRDPSLMSPEYAKIYRDNLATKEILDSFADTYEASVAGTP